MSFTKLTVPVAATALALLAPAVRAEPQDVLRTSDAGVVEALEQEVAVATSDDWVSGAALNTTYSNYLEIEDKYVMTVSSYYRDDKRTSDSYYVCATEMKDLIMTATFSADPVDEDGSVLMQVDSVVGHSDAAKNTHGWYLSVLDEKFSDTYRGFYRLNVQPHKSKATKWYFPPGTKTGSRFMRVREAPGTPKLNGMDLKLRAGAWRDRTSVWLVIGGSSVSAEVKLK